MAGSDATVPPHLRALLDQLRAAFPSGVSQSDYRPLLVVLVDDMSEEGLSAVAGALTGRDPVVVANDAADAASRTPPRREDVDRVRRHLESAGWQPELRE